VPKRKLESIRSQLDSTQQQPSHCEEQCEAFVTTGGSPRHGAAVICREQEVRNEHQHIAAPWPLS
ncbi:hypothetical protein KUCAC02_003225, partial [Chaenocephalus aceratus]